MNYSNLDIKQTLARFILDELVSDPDVTALGPEDDLLDDSIIDSLGIMRLIGFVEQRYGYVVPSEDVTVENFETVNAIVGYLHPNLRSE